MGIFKKTLNAQAQGPEELNTTDLKIEAKRAYIEGAFRRALACYQVLAERGEAVGYAGIGAAYDSGNGVPKIMTPPTGTIKKLRSWVMFSLLIC
jgi:hypothetical protein